MNAYVPFAEKQSLTTGFTFDADASASVHVAQMMGVDYIFLQSQSGAPSENHIAQLTAQTLEVLELSPDNTMVICVELNQAGEPVFKRCDIHWLDNYPVHIHPKTITTATQTDFYITILEHSHAL